MRSEEDSPDSFVLWLPLSARGGRATCPSWGERPPTKSLAGNPNPHPAPSCTCSFSQRKGERPVPILVQTEFGVHPQSSCGHPSTTATTTATIASVLAASNSPHRHSTLDFSSPILLVLFALSLPSEGLHTAVFLLSHSLLLSVSEDRAARSAFLSNPGDSYCIRRRSSISESFSAFASEA